MSSHVTAMIDAGRKVGQTETLHMLRAFIKQVDRAGPDFRPHPDMIVNIVEHALAEGWNPDEVVVVLERAPEGPHYVRGVATNAAPKGGMQWRFYANKQAQEWEQEVERINDRRAAQYLPPIRYR